MRLLIVENDSAVSLLPHNGLMRRRHVVAGIARGLEEGMRLADYDGAIADYPASDATIEPALAGAATTPGDHVPVAN